MSTVWLIRHGESISNADLPTRHPAESELTEKGLREAQYIAEAFTEKPDLIVVSPFIRARQTAEPTIRRFAPAKVEEWPVHEFTYLAAERYLNTTGTQRRPYALAYWQQNDPFLKEEGEGESFAELLERVWDTVERLRRTTAVFTAVFSHGLFLRALLWALLTDTREPTALGLERYSHFVRAVRLPNGAIIKAAFPANGRISISPAVTDHIPADLT